MNDYNVTTNSALMIHM